MIYGQPCSWVTGTGAHQPLYPVPLTPGELGQVLLSPKTWSHLAQRRGPTPQAHVGDRMAPEAAHGGQTRACTACWPLWPPVPSSPWKRSASPAWGRARQSHPPCKQPGVAWKGLPAAPWDRPLGLPIVPIKSVSFPKPAFTVALEPPLPISLKFQFFSLISSPHCRPCVSWERNLLLASGWLQQRARSSCCPHRALQPQGKGTGESRCGSRKCASLPTKCENKVFGVTALPQQFMHSVPRGVGHIWGLLLYPALTWDWRGPLSQHP